MPAKAGTSHGVEARRVALHILLRVETEAAFADVLLGSRIAGFTPPDRRLITRLVLGTIAWRGRLDYELERLSSRPLDRITSEILVLLRMGLFQLRFLDRIPAHAVVDTSVGLARTVSRSRGASGFVNAILRAALRDAVRLPARSASPEYLAVAYSHPLWLAEKFIEWFGIDDAEKLMAANNEAAPNSLRVNLARSTRDDVLAALRAAGADIEASNLFPETIVLRAAPDLGSFQFRDGLVYSQSEASQLVARLLAPAARAVVADCAAAPGGKATHLAELVGGEGRVIAMDANLAGLKKARALASRMGHANVSFVRADLAVGAPLRAASFDYALLDAPCTGLGTLREHPEIRWRLRPGDFARMASLQLRMLANSAALVRPGGALVYAVCSVAPDEGVGVIRSFLAGSPGFSIDRKPPEHDRVRVVLDEHGYMQTRPDRDGRDGFFAVRLIREP